ncbi:hypothetical protein ACN47E_008347 [Coniothyrium glycines]
MSLNGLDAVDVTQAYQAALAEAGGWFLLRYASRDAVELLTRGAGGAAEARDALARYDEKSPLYGLLLYRRRKVLLRYVPEGTSRLLQARVAVHFITITERFAPHDIVLPISLPEELGDAALASACTLHTAAPSTSSSSGSARQQKLSWIQEAAEEGSQVNGDDNGHAARPPPGVSVIPTILEPISSHGEEPLRNGSVTSQASHAETVPLILEEKVVEIPVAPRTTSSTVDTATEGAVTPGSDLTELQATLRSYDKLFEDGPEPRLSSQTTRPNYNELYEHYYAQYTKPKVKLGPRPRPSLDGRRPSTSGSQDLARPVSSLPSGLRSSSRKVLEKKESKTKTSSLVPNIAIPPPPPIPMTPEMPHSPVSSAYSSRTPASVKSMPVSAYSSHHRSTGMTQERTRLMKALELRKKQQKAREDKLAKGVEDAATTNTLNVEQEAATSAVHEPPKPESEPVASAEVSLATTDAQQAHDARQESEIADNASASSGLKSSGLVFASDRTEADEMNSAASVSSPISAQTQGSSGAPSTRPSSVSEDELPSSEEKGMSEAALESASTDTLDEEQSVDSATTIKAGSKAPAPSVETEDPSNRRTITADELPSSDASLQFDQASIPGLSLPSDGVEAYSRRSSKRESTLYISPGDPFEYDDAQAQRRNRESVHLPTNKRQSWYESKDRRRVMLDPLQVSAENSETEYLSDDSFMEELQSATVHQAKPMSVSKSPITPVFPRKGSCIDVATITPPRSASGVYQGIDRLSPDQTGRRASSAPWPPRAKAEVVVAKKINVSSGISQRIKALAEKSNHERSVSPASPAGALDNSSHTLAQRKSSFFATTPMETSPKSRPATRLGSPSFLSPTTSTTPEKKKQPAGPVRSTVYSVQREAEKPESVQVTARIVRNEHTRQPTLAMPTEITPLELHQSPLIIDHQKPVYTPKSPTRGRPEPTSPRTTSSSHSREQSIAPSRTSSESTWRAFGRRMSESKSIHSHDGEEKRDEKKDKKESRTSKMFKRMSSSMSSMPWKNSTNNLSLPEYSMTSTSLSSVREPPPAVHLGDLNVQFPDTLLWKRRWAEIDAMGNIVLSPSRSNEKGVIKRYHLSEFRTPYPPDQDRQELPNSVVLDFVDGRTLQCACETYTAQAQVLQILREAHDAWLACAQAS